MTAELVRADSVKSNELDIEKVNNLILMGKQAMEGQLIILLIYPKIYLMVVRCPLSLAER